MDSKALITFAIAIALGVAGCAQENDAVSTKLKQGGFTEKTARELSGKKLTDEEVNNLVSARKSGLDETSLVGMVDDLHENDLPFVIGTDTQILTQAGMSATAITQLVEMGAIPMWADDVRALKEFGVSDVTIVELAKLKFEQKKEILSGGMYGRLKQFQMSDAGVLTFARKGGDAQQLEVVARELAMGKPEQEALATAGVK
jgi:hypothetical protein